jgi:tetratricopeptide (TPR) repeat protein
VWPVRAGLVPPLAEGFVTRPETVPGLAAALVPGTVVALVSGPVAGSRPPRRVHAGGKTQLAAWCAESLWWSREVDLLAWVAAGSRASVLAGFAEAAAAVGIDAAGAGACGTGAASTAEQVAARFTGWLAEAARPWLLVLDGLRDAADLDGLWPRGPAGLVVITARDEKAVAGAAGARVLRVGAFSSREAMKYLMGRLSADTDQRHGAMGLAAELGCQPLALAQACAVIATSMASCEDYRDRFARRRAQRATSDDGELPAVGEVTWRLSMEQAERLAPGGAVRMLLAFAAQLGGQPVPGAVFLAAAACGYLAEAGIPAVADPEHAWDAVLALERTGLLAIDATSTPTAVWVGPVVAAHLQAATPAEMAGRAVSAVADALVEVWPDEPEPPGPPGLVAGLRSCVTGLHLMSGERLWAAGAPHPVLLRAGHSLDHARLTGPAVSYWTDLATTSEKILGPDDPATLTIASHLARALLVAGQAAQAVEWSHWVLAGQMSALGPGHPDTLATRVSLGRALVAAGQPHHAVTVVAKATADYERGHGPDHPGTLSARDELAAACLAAGQPADAIGLYHRTLADRERLHGPGHPDTLAARDTLAAACLADGRFKDAIAQRRHAVVDRQRALGADHPDTLAAQVDLAAAYQAAGKIATALQLQEQACADYQRVLGAGHPHTLAHRADLARAYHAAGRLADAATLARDTLTCCEQALPPGDPLTCALRQTMTTASAL